MRKSPSSSPVAAWFDQYHDQLLRFLVRNMGEQSEAQDLAQEVFLRLLRIDDPDLIEHPRAYLYRVAVNVIQEWRLRNQRFPIQEDFDPDDIAGWDEPAADAEANERARHLDAALQELPTIYRTVILLRVNQGLTHNEVAEELDITPRMVKRYLIKAYARLRERLQHMRADLP